MSNSSEVIFDIIASLERRIKYLEKRDEDLDNLEEKFRILELKFQESQIELHSDADGNEQDGQGEENEIGQNIVISQVFSNFKKENSKDLDKKSTFSNGISDAKMNIETLENADETASKIKDQVQSPSKSRSGRLLKKRKLSSSEDSSNELFDCQICLKSFSTFRGLETHSQTHNNPNLVNKIIKKVKNEENQPKASPPRPIRRENNDGFFEESKSYQNWSKNDKNPMVMKRHNIVQSGRYKCPYPHCMKKYRHNDSLKLHIQNIHYKNGEILQSISDF